jgi:glycosyltransferase involved in cell wall biosynthesis
VQNKINPLVSVIINCRNGEKFLNRSISSVLKQTYQNFEIIFFDNFSTDNTSKIIKSINNRKIKYFKSSKLLKLYHARDLAVQKCNGDFIAFLDIDDWWEKKKLKVQINDLIKKNASISCSNYIIHNDIKNKSYLAFNNVPEIIDTNILLKKNYISLCTLMFKKKDYLELDKGFDHEYEVIGDYDLCLRLSKNRIISFIEMPLANYSWHTENLSNTKRKLNFDELVKWINENKKFSKYSNYNYLKSFAYYNLILSCCLEDDKKSSLGFIKYLSFFHLIKSFILLILPSKFLKIIRKI